MDNFPFWKFVHLYLGIMSRYTYQGLVVGGVYGPGAGTVESLLLRGVSTRLKERRGFRRRTSSSLMTRKTSQGLGSC